MSTEIKEGSYIKIPKGTKIYTEYNTAYINDAHVITSRDSVAKVSNVYQNYNRNYEETNKEPMMVSWGEHKTTELANVIEVPAPAPRKINEAKAKEPTLRQRMVKGTKWKLTQDAQVMKESHTMAVNADGHRYIKSSVEPDFVLPAGTEITITGKISNYGPASVHGIWVPITTDCKLESVVEFKELNKKPEQIGETKVIPMFAIWDTAKKKYYSGYEYGEFNHATYSYTNSEISYTDKLTKAKKFKRLADVRVHALIQSGYYDDLPESWGSVPDWMGRIKALDVPDTWEIVKYDKLTKKEIERIELVDTFKRSWRLRELTVEYSSTVRKVYSDLEKKGKLDEWSSIMMFKKNQEDKYWTDELSHQDIEDINNLLGRFGDDVKIQKGTSGFAVAIKDAMTATMIRLAYQGDLKCAIIDFKTMEEVANS